jgi:AraC-like DNA-binding protein
LFFTGLSIWHFTSLQPLPDRGKKVGKMKEAARTWVKQILIFQVFFGICWTVTLLIPLIWQWPFSWSHYYPIEIILVVFLYWIAIAGYFKIRRISPDVEVKKDAPEKGRIGKNENSPQMILIQDAMETARLYLNPELSLVLLSEKTGIAPKQISKTLNQEAGMNFNDFVNTYRVEAFCGELKKPENNNLTLLGIASRCGFNSSATFQRTFKKLKGVTPGAYFQRREEMGHSGR